MKSFVPSLSPEAENSMSFRQAYWMLACITCINLAWISLSRISLLWEYLSVPATELFFIVLTYFVFQLSTITRLIPYLAQQIRALMYGLTFLTLASVNLKIFNHLTMTTALPLQDALLSHWDEMLGFDWSAYFQFVHDWPAFLRLLDISYTSLTPLIVLVFILLIVMGLNKRAYFFVEISFYTAIACAVIGLVFPADAAVVYYGINHEQFPNFPSTPGVYHIKHMALLRQPDVEIVLHPLILPGLVTFPSFHTAVGILMCVATYRSWLFIPVIAYSGTMIAATPIFGGHYLVDLIAGTLIALIVTGILCRRVRYRDVWASSPLTLRDLMQLRQNRQ